MISRLIVHFDQTVSVTDSIYRQIHSAHFLTLLAQKVFIM